MVFFKNSLKNPQKSYFQKLSLERSKFLQFKEISLKLRPLRICRQNTQFNMYTTTSKQQEGCTFKDSHPKCFIGLITTNFDKLHREGFARGGESPTR